MKNLKPALASLILLFGLTALTACDQTLKTEDGRIPEALLENAQRWTGAYSGAVNRQPQELAFRLEGDRPVLETAIDLTGDSTCGSAAGPLKAIRFKKKKSQLVDLEFAFDPGSCTDSFEGRTLTVQADLLKDGSVRAIRYAIFRDTRPQYYCDPVTDPVTGEGGVRCGVRRVARFLVSDDLVRR